MPRIFKTSCPLNCWDSCGFQVTVEDDKVIKIEGDPDHPITKGKICGRGRSLATRANDPNRLLHPLKKVEGQFIQISWDQALDEISTKMLEVKKSESSTAILHSYDYSNNGLLKNLDLRFFNAFGGVTEVVGSLCWGSGIEAQIWDFGNAYSHTPDDIKNSRQIVVWGRNAARTNIHLFNELQAAKKRGIPIVVIDPIYNASAKLADLYVPIKPGMDGLLALGVIKEILRLGKEDRTFIDEHTYGFLDLKKTLEKISIEEIVEITNVSRETIDRLTDIYLNGPTSTFLGLGMQRYKNGGESVRWIDALVAISGNIGKPGGGVNYANLAVGQSFDIENLARTDLKTTSRFFTRMNQAKQILEASDPKIKMAFVTRSNPLTQIPDTNKAYKAFTSIETLVVIDQFMTDSAKIANYVLPCTTVFEEEDIYYSSMYHHYVNYGPKLISPLGEARSDLQIWKDLANRLGFGDHFHQSVDELLSTGLNKMADHGITLRKIKQEQQVALPVQSIPWSDYQFQTPSGKFEFTSLKAESEGLNGKPVIVFPEESEHTQPGLAKKYPYQLISMHPMRSNHSQHYPWQKKDHKLFVEISRAIAEGQGLNEGDYVEVYNDRGNIRGEVSILKEAHPLTINIDEGRWQQFGGSVNQLTLGEKTNIGLGSTLYDCRVNIKKIEFEKK